MPRLARPRRNLAIEEQRIDPTAAAIDAHQPDRKAGHSGCPRPETLHDPPSASDNQHRDRQRNQGWLEDSKRQSNAGEKEPVLLPEVEEQRPQEKDHDRKLPSDPGLENERHERDG